MIEILLAWFHYFVSRGTFTAFTSTASATAALTLDGKPTAVAVLKTAAAEEKII